MQTESNEIHTGPQPGRPRRYQYAITINTFPFSLMTHFATAQCERWRPLSAERGKGILRGTHTFLQNVLLWAMRKYIKQRKGVGAMAHPGLIMPPLSRDLARTPSPASQGSQWTPRQQQCHREALGWPTSDLRSHAACRGNHRAVKAPAPWPAAGAPGQPGEELARPIRVETVAPAGHEHVSTPVPRATQDSG